VHTPDTVASALGRLYEAFAHVPRPEAVEGCSHCFTESEGAALLAPVPLRELSAKTLRPYTASALFTVGEAADFRYFLPRMLDIACTDASAWPDLGSLGGRLRIAEWSTWAPEEQAAIRDLLHTYWKAALAEQTGHRSAESVLEDIGEIEDELTPYLEEWTHSICMPAAAAGLRELLWYSTRPVEPDFPRSNTRPVTDTRTNSFNGSTAPNSRAPSQPQPPTPET
jgi:hypothetical protein